MKKSISVNVKKKGRGRPATGTDPAVAVRLPPNVLAEVDKWAAANDASRSDAIRHMIEIALAAGKKSPKQLASEAWVKKTQERWADRITDLGWRTRLENILSTAARNGDRYHGEDWVKKEAWELFGVKWSPRKRKAD
jgi:Ribbon-helix-helix protein, copG family